MKREDYKNALEEMYKEYYSGDGSYCRFFNECQKNAEKPCVIASDKARVGKKYGSGKVPKIVFVGLEGLPNEEPEGANVYKPIIAPSHSADNPHYMGVRYVLAYLLSGFCNKNKPRDASAAVLDKYRQTIDYFALLNCYKCAFYRNEQSSKLSRTKAMKKNCQEILLREIEILKPDILVIQVKTDRPTDLEENIITRFGGGLKGELLDGNSTTGAYKYGSFVLVWTYHGAGGPPNKPRCWVNNADYIKTLNHTLDIVIEEFKKSRQ